MKRFYNAILTLIMVAAIPAIVEAQPKIAFDKMEHNFGTFKEADGIQTTTFEFTNKGTTPLILSSVNASCGCTTPEWTKQPVPPGAKGNIKVSYNPANRPGAFNKTVSVQSNAENAMAILTIKGTVQEKEKTIAELYPREIGPLRTQNNHISYPTLKTSEVKTEKLELVNDTDKPVTVGIRTVPPHIKATVEPAVIAPKSRGSLSVTYDAKAANTYGFVSHRIYLTIDGSSDYKYSIGVSATIEEDFAALSAAELASAPVAAFNTMSYDFGDIKQGEKKEYTFELSNKGKRDLMIRNVRSSCGCTAVSPAKNVIAPGETSPIKVVFDSTGKKGRQAKSVTVITNDPKNATINLRISTNIL